MPFLTDCEIQDNIEKVQQQIKQFAKRNKRLEQDIKLLPVSKTKPVANLLAAYQYGIRDFGENYLQDAMIKITQLPSDINWHFIGSIQSNKTKIIAEHFSWVHTIDRLKIADRLNRQRPDDTPPLKICLQINIDNEANKSGFDPNHIDELIATINQIKSMENISLEGLMTIPKSTNDIDQQKSSFHTLKQLLVNLNKKCQTNMTTLSMGMSNDLEAAIAEGSTIVRIGSNIFGARN